MGSTSSGSALSQLNAFLVEVACEANAEAKSRLLDDARAAVEKALIADPHNSDLHHALGLTWYHEPAWSDEARQSVVHCFRKALELESGHQFASLYLGHFYFDEGQYEEALDFFSRADESYFENLGQHWRVLKNRELVLCCRLYLKLNEAGLNEIDQLCTAYEAADNENWMPPTQIVVCLAQLAKETEMEVMVIARRVLEMIRRIDLETAYARMDEYRVLKHLVYGS